MAMEINFKKIGMAGFSCACCGTPIPTDGLVAACTDCGAVFCKACAEDGALDGHECEPDEI